MEYQIALPPDLGLSPADFVSTWNADPASRQQAEALLSASTSANYDLLTDTIAVLSTVGVGVLTNAVYDLIKQVLVKHGVKKHMQITQVDQPDGTHTLVVVIDEK